ncbi:MAG: hypothetical protein NT131_04225 [Methanomassiliicoccales archaeon]|nr:hypothetical protein [Methanomassiliicoccales archaeon]
MEASAELSNQQALLNKIRKEDAHQFRRLLIPLAFLLLMTAIILIYPKALFIWFVVSLFLYSYNFLFLLLPTTSKESRSKRRGSMMRPGPDHKWLGFKLLLKKRKLAVEMGLTLFLGRMVPLTISFTIIMGLGMSILVYFLLTAYTAASGLTWLITGQVVLILLFYILVNVLRPQAQGISTLEKSWKLRLGKAHSRGRAAIFLVRLTVVGMITISATLFIGALILPGVTFVTLLSSLGDFTNYDLLLAIGVFAVQMWVMRSFQSIMSRRMAIKLLYVRIDKLQELLQGAEKISSIIGEEFEIWEGFETILSEYYSMMVYDIFRLDFFGRAPVYLVGPRLVYILDDRALSHIPD